MKLCEASSCGIWVQRAKYCSVHQLRFLRHGDPNFRTRVAKGEWDGVYCRVPDCERFVKTKGICSLHYSRDQRLKSKGLPLKYQDKE